jgi:hypothetical protein
MLLAAAGMLLAAGGIVLLTPLGVDSTYAAHVLSGLLVIGLGLASATAMGTATLGVRPDDAGVASATVNTMQQNGGSIGTALLSTLAASATSSYAAAHATATDAMAQAAAHGYTTAFWWSAAIFAAGAIVSGLLIRPGTPQADPAGGSMLAPLTLQTPGLTASQHGSRSAPSGRASGRGRRRVRSQELLRTCGAIARTRNAPSHAQLASGHALVALASAGTVEKQVPRSMLSRLSLWTNSSSTGRQCCLSTTAAATSVAAACPQEEHPRETLVSALLLSRGYA